MMKTSRSAVSTRPRRGGRAGVAAALVVALVATWVAAWIVGPAAASDEIRIGYLSQAQPRPPGLSDLDAPVDDAGLQGARLAIADNNTTGRFTGQTFVLVEQSLAADGDIATAYRALLADGVAAVIANLSGDGLDRLLTAADTDTALIFNAGAADDRFRRADCRTYLLHTAPSRAMLADALVQYLVKKNWKRWFLVIGRRPADALYADALRRAATRFGGRIVTEKTWQAAGDFGRTAEAEVPVFTQVGAYDVLLVADEIGAFGEYLPYRTWDPRLVAGTQGLMPLAWHRTLEQWGGRQLQSRFQRLAGRPMTAADYAAWAAVRSIGEAASRTGSADSGAIDGYIRSDNFELAGFKGLTLSYRPWDGQLRQPIPLVTAKSIVSMSPQEGFLHPLTALDTLGDDRPESACKQQQ